MVDIVPPAVRSKMMSGIRAKNTKPEMQVRQALHALGFRYRLHRKELAGCPDIVMTSRKIAIFVHGCFWHQHVNCRYAKLPGTRSVWWRDKLDKNQARDERAIAALMDAGWRVLVIWECALRNRNTSAVIGQTVAQWIDSRAESGSISG